jgi:type VI protein secretion system component Hcp
MTCARYIYLALLLLIAQLAVLDSAVAAVSYVSIPGIGGVDPTPGYPTAMAASKVTITPNTFSVTKSLDAASPQLFAAVAGGTPLGTSNMLLYNTAPAGPPDATLDFFNTFATAAQFLDVTTERVDFSASNPLALFLELPGINGESDTPGHPNVMQISSFSLTGNQFDIIKLQGSASPALFLANAIGDHFPVARLLLYDSLPPQASPDAVIEFHNLLIASSQTIANPVPPREQHTFAFQSLSQPIPEPASLAVIAIAAAFATCNPRRRKK